MAGLGLFLGSATNAYNAADAEQFRRDTIQRKQDWEDKQNARVQKGWDLEDAQDAATKGATTGAQAYVDQRQGGGDILTSDTAAEKMGLQGLPPEVMQQLIDAGTNGADLGAVARAYRQDPKYRAPDSSIPGQAAIPAVAPTTTFGSGLPPTSGGATSPFSSDDYTPGKAAVPAVPAQTTDDASLANMRSYKGADGNVYTTSQNRAAPTRGETMIAQGQALTQLGDARSAAMGNQMITVGMAADKQDYENGLDKIMRGKGSPEDKISAIADQMNGSSTIPGAFHVVNQNGAFSLVHMVHGQEDPMTVPLEGKTATEALNSYLAQAKLAHDPEAMSSFLKNNASTRASDAQTRHSDAATIGAGIDNQTRGISNLADIQAKRASAASGFASAAYHNEATKESKANFDTAQALQNDHNAYLNLPEAQQSPEALKKLIVRGAVLSASKSGDYTSVFKAMGKDKVAELSPSEKIQMEGYFGALGKAMHDDPTIIENPKKVEALKQSTLQAYSIAPSSHVWGLLGAPDAKAIMNTPQGGPAQPATGTGIPDPGRVARQAQSAQSIDQMNSLSGNSNRRQNILNQKADDVGNNFDSKLAQIKPGIPRSEAFKLSEWFDDNRDQMTRSQINQFNAARASAGL